MTKPVNFIAGLLTNEDAWGVVLALSASDPFYDFDVRVAPDDSGAPDLANIDVVATGVPGTSATFTHRTPADNDLRWFSIRHSKGAAYVASAWTPWQSCKPYPLATAFSALSHAVEGRRRGDSLYHSDGQLTTGVQLQSAGVPRNLARGYLEGLARHGDLVVFPQPLENAAMISLFGGVVYEPRSKFGTDAQIIAGTASGARQSTQPLYQELEALNPTASQFTVRARLRQPGVGTITERQLDFPANSLDVIGETVESPVLVVAAAYDDHYKIQYDVTIAITPAAIFVDASKTFHVAVDSWDGSAWTERAVRVYSLTAPWDGGPVSQSWLGEQIQVTVAGLDLSSKFRVRIKDIIETNSPQDDGSEVRGHGAGGGDVWGVQYFTISSAPTYASMTPEVSDVTRYQVLEVA